MAHITDRIAGKWCIIETAAWDNGHLDLCGPVFEIDAQGRGSMAFGAPEASLDCSLNTGSIDFERTGIDEGNQVAVDGSADLRDDGCLDGEITHHWLRHYLCRLTMDAFFSRVLMPYVTTLTYHQRCRRGQAWLKIFTYAVG